MITETIEIGDIVFVKDNKVLLVQQAKPSARGLWCLPGGHVEEGETAEQAAVREAREEVGVDVIDIKYLGLFPLDIPRGKLNLNTFVGSFVGDIRIDNDEIMDFGWFSLDEIKSNKVAIRTPNVVKQAEAALKL